MSDRIPCLNPRCRRTAPVDKYGPGVEIVCRKCWKLLPRRMTEDYRRLKKARRRLDRLIARRLARGIGVPARVGSSLDAQIEQNWRDIHNYFVQPERPVGLDAFLEEMGMG